MGEIRSLEFLRQRISIEIQHGIAVFVLGTLNEPKDLDFLSVISKFFLFLALLWFYSPGIFLYYKIIYYLKYLKDVKKHGCLFYWLATAFRLENKVQALK